MSTGQIYVVSAPSGAGKTSLVNALIESIDGITASVSHTTREPRAGEIDGTDYHFVSESEFERMATSDELLENATVFGHRYGTSKLRVDSYLQDGVDVLLEIDWQGARQIRQARPDSRSIFILPPSLEELHARLVHRGQDDPSIIEDRMAEALDELSHYDEYGYIIVNDDFNQALADLSAIIHATRLVLEIQQRRLSELLQQLMA